ncbi:uncharacterized protein METZ01_LOCUS256006, partial [marine metagenome]
QPLPHPGGDSCGRAACRLDIGSGRHQVGPAWRPGSNQGSSGADQCHPHSGLTGRTGRIGTGRVRHGRRENVGSTGRSGRPADRRFRPALRGSFLAVAGLSHRRVGAGKAEV